MVYTRCTQGRPVKVVGGMGCAQMRLGTHVCGNQARLTGPHAVPIGTNVRCGLSVPQPQANRPIPQLELLSNLPQTESRSL
jgi:hypothetical protein